MIDETKEKKRKNRNLIIRFLLSFDCWWEEKCFDVINDKTNDWRICFVKKFYQVQFESLSTVLHWNRQFIFTIDDRFLFFNSKKDSHFLFCSMINWKNIDNEQIKEFFFFSLLLNKKKSVDQSNIENNWFVSFSSCQSDEFRSISRFYYVFFSISRSNRFLFKAQTLINSLLIVNAKKDFRI